MMRGLFGIVIAVAVIGIAAAAVKCPPQVGDDVTLIENPENCTTYYSCNGGHPFLMSCPDGLYFNPDLRVCDWNIRDEENGCQILEKSGLVSELEAGEGVESASGAEEDGAGSEEGNI